MQSGFEQHVEYVVYSVIKSVQKRSKQPLQHLPLQESVKVHGVLVVFKRCPTQVVMNGPGQTHSTSQRTLRQHSYNCCNVMWCKLHMAGRKQVRPQQTGEGEQRQWQLTCGNCWRSPYMDSARGSLCTGLRRPLLCLHAEVTTSAHVSTHGDIHTHIDKCITFYCTHQSNWGETYITPQWEQNSIRT